MRFASRSDKCSLFEPSPETLYRIKPTNSPSGIMTNSVFKCDKIGLSRYWYWLQLPVGKSQCLKHYCILSIKRNVLLFLATLLTPSFGNRLFEYYIVLKHPNTDMILLSFCIPKVVKSATNILKIGS